MADQDKEYFSKEGLQKAKAELEHLRTKKRKEIADRLEYAKSLGDLSENAEYQEAKEAQLLNEGKIIELEESLRKAVIVEHSASRDKVEIGSQVVVEDERGQKLTFSIVGSKETSPEENKISNESPMGAAILGKKINDVVSVQLPKGEKRYKIIDIL